MPRAIIGGEHGCGDDRRSIGQCTGKSPTKQAIYVLRNIGARSRNHYYHATATSITFLLYVFSISYPACKAHVPYCYLWPVWLFHTIS